MILKQSRLFFQESDKICIQNRDEKFELIAISDKNKKCVGCYFESVCSSELEKFCLNTIFIEKEKQTF